MRRRVVHLPTLTPQQHHEVMQGSAGLPELRKRLAAQHPIHEAFGMAFDNLNGVTGLTDWAQKNQTDFYKLFKSLAPTPQNVRHSGQVKIALSLQRNPALDGEAPIDAEFEEIP